ncbi:MULTISPECIES: DUF1569 domain-containing protein [Chryseobacterium]|uniref:DUF1569 domain-containing protein n=1 Tax=Chryseobacterium TaxID=59732 RepID=UPI002359A36C|nr:MULTISPECIES: DUF1569 domain-containing protein [unclassified Chryseobacterium]MDC8103753.1 DUF1569 domain-containing protein [Chryseobacterium sp. B21-037]MDQ1803361.1 DUF1569 domain-containing protein [Chryseobacterium sp. CKR4-1]WBV57286.1 DUF1569 domain-containing protein [Chryseobacterium daecheongense]
MKTIFEHKDRQELIERISALTDNKTAQWGKMNLYQMIRHCTVWNDWILGRNKQEYKQEFLGKLFGRMALKRLLREGAVMDKNVPAGEFAIKEKTGDTDLYKKIWLEQIAAYENYSNPDFIHNFFGKMKTEDLGMFVYKHMDHHLRQFNV